MNKDSIYLVMADYCYCDGVTTNIVSAHKLFDDAKKRFQEKNNRKNEEIVDVECDDIIYYLATIDLE